jgi:hypothetical protein
LTKPNPGFVLCINNEGCAVSLERRKVYRTLSDPEAEGHGFLRVIDESGEDYLFPAAFFVPIEVPAAAERIFSGAGC